MAKNLPGHVLARARDIPISCCCHWKWDQTRLRYYCPVRNPDCPWHTKDKP